MDRKRVLIIAIAIIATILVITLGCFLIYLVIQNRFVSQDEMVGLASNEIDTDETETSGKINTDEDDDIEIIEEVNAFTSPYIIRALISNGWDVNGNGMTDDYVKVEDGKYYYNGYTVYTDNGTFVDKVIFNTDYTSSVIEDLKVGDKKEDVIDVLGEPSYETSNIYGYKLNSVYAFFYDDEIVLYPNIDVSNEDLENSIYNYSIGNYDGNQTNFIVEIRQTYSDFTAEEEDDEVVLTSLNRQIQIRFNGSFEKTKMVIYNGYKQGSIVSNYLGVVSNIIDVRQEDFVFNAEQERINAEDND